MTASSTAVVIFVLAHTFNSPSTSLYNKIACQVCQHGLVLMQLKFNEGWHLMHHVHNPQVSEHINLKSEGDATSLAVEAIP